MLPSSVILQSDSQSVRLGFVLNYKCCGGREICGVPLWFFAVKLEKCIFGMICWIVLIRISSLLKCCLLIALARSLLILKSMLEPLIMAIVFADFTVTLRIVDESRKAGISATFFADNTALLPCVKSSGDVISLHDVVVQHKTLFNYAICHWVFLGVL